MNPTRLDLYLHEIATIQPLLAWEERALLRRKDSDPEARERLQRNYLHRVVRVARTMRVDAPLLDVIEEGNVGLALAILKYRSGDLPAYIDHFVRRAIERRFGGTEI